MEAVSTEARDSLLVFVSYSSHDGTSFAMRLRDNLKKLPHVNPWIDVDRPVGYPFPQVLQSKIQACNLLLFVMTRDSVQSPWCKRELSLALRIGKRIIPLRMHNDAELPIELEGLTSFKFTAEEEWPSGLKELSRQLSLISSPEAKLEALEHRRLALVREASQATGQTRQRVESVLAVVEQQEQEQQRRVSDPQGARRQAVEGIQLAQARERSDNAVPVALSGMRCVNDPPPLLPNKFRDRAVETEILERHLHDPAIRFVAVVGPDGIGKTAMISQFRETLRKEPRRLPLDAFIYLPAYGPRLIRSAVMLDDLRKVVPDPTAAVRLAERLNDPALTLLEKLDEVLEELIGTTVIVLDDAEALLDTSRRLRDPELNDLVRTLLARSDHGVKLVFVTRDAPEWLLRDNPISARRLDVNGGLSAADSSAFLRSLDNQGTFWLRSAPDEDLQRIYQLTKGHPRALELIYTVLRSDPGTSLVKLLREMEQLAPDQDIFEFLVGRSFDMLESIDRRIIEALAAYGRPVISSAVDHLLQSYLPGYVSAAALRRLTDAHFIQQAGKNFYVHPSPDGEWVLAGIPMGSPDDRDQNPPPWTELALWHQAADYFADTHKNRVECVDDLSPDLSEIDLRMRGSEYGTAVRLMSTVDSEYLRRWGYSDVLASWREDLKGKLSDQHLEMHNLTSLAAAKRQQDDQKGAIAGLRDALAIAGRRRDAINQVRIQIDLGSAHYDDGQVSMAAQYYEQALSTARKHRKLLQEAKAREGLCLCLAETGQFQPALKHLTIALLLIEEASDAKMQHLEPELLLNKGWVYGQLGQSQEALDALRQGQRLAHQLDEPLLDGQFLGEEAEVLISDGEWHSAIELARKAVAIGARTRDIRLSREANRTLALAYLCGEDVNAAGAAADAAARYRRSHRALGAFAIKGVAAFRMDEIDKARLAFLEAHEKARMLQEQESTNFRVLDTDGLALCGLALCEAALGGDHEELRPAISVYRAARKVTRAQGAVRRSLLLLDKLTDGCDLDMCAEVRRAAAGQ